MPVRGGSRRRPVGHYTVEDGPLSGMATVLWVDDARPDATPGVVLGVNQDRIPLLFAALALYMRRPGAPEAAPVSPPAEAAP